LPSHDNSTKPYIDDRFTPTPALAAESGSTTITEPVDQHDGR
jgi:hypothetical protein